MDYRKLALGIGAFAGAAATLIGGAVLAEGYSRRRDAAGRAGAGDGPATGVTASGEPNAAAPVVSAAGGERAGSGADVSLGAVTASGEPARPANASTAPGALTAGHVPTDLLADRVPGAHDRAPAAFRPDMDAPMTAAEREALRPATGPGPSLVSGVPNVAEEVVRPAS